MSTEVSDSLTGPWEVTPSVSLRPESFGALAYDFDSRRLTFVKDSRLVAVIRALAASADVDEAFTACGIDDEFRLPFRRALLGLAAQGTIRPRQCA